MRGFSALLLVALVIGLAPSAVTAQTDRDGFFIGFGFGLGTLGVEDVDDRENAISGYLKLGGAINDKVLLGAETNSWVKTETVNGANATLTSSSLAAVAYVYPDPASGFYLKAGIGLARIEAEASSFGVRFTDGENGTAFTAGIGYDIGFGGRFGLTPFANLVYSSFDGGSSNLFQAGLGVNWY